MESLTGGARSFFTPAHDSTIRLLNIRFTKSPLPKGVPGEGLPASEYVICAVNESPNKKGPKSTLFAYRVLPVLDRIDFAAEHEITIGNLHKSKKQSQLTLP